MHEPIRFHVVQRGTHPVPRERLPTLDAAILPFAALRSALACRLEIARKEI
jgi:hypothetical protein